MSNSRVDNGWLAIDIRLYRIHLQFSRWIEDASFGGVDVDALRDHFSVSIMRMVKESYERGGLFPAAVTALECVLRALGLQAFAPSLQSSSPNPSSDDRPLTFKFVKVLRSKTGNPAHKFMPITEDPVEWQMRLFGEYMDRSMDSQWDPRVSFKPDAWQRKVLDCIDKNQSLLVVGKLPVIICGLQFSH